MIIATCALQTLQRSYNSQNKMQSDVLTIDPPLPSLDVSIRINGYFKTVVSHDEDRHIIRASCTVEVYLGQGNIVTVSQRSS